MIVAVALDPNLRSRQTKGVLLGGAVLVVLIVVVLVLVVGVL